jgi:NAD(P)-dependent dehydrogenase (short-subunit alcohol dehydrogenase family)
MIEMLAVEKIGLRPGILEDKVAIVTGAGRGIGKEIAKAFAFLGVKVAVLDVSEAGAQTSDQITRAGGKAMFVKVDLAEERNIEAAVKQVLERFGRVDILVNNAIVSPVESVEKMSAETWDTAITVNLRAPFILTKTLLPTFIAQKSGIIINMLSSAGALPPEVGQAFMSAYSASKGGLAAFTLSLAPEVERSGIRVTGVWIGITDTPGAREAFKTLSVYLETPFEQFEAAMVGPDKVAAVIAYVTVNIEDYHGCTVECEKLMDKLLLTEAAVPQTEVLSTAFVEPKLNTEANLNVLYNEQAQSIQNLLKIIDEIKAGFNQLPFFVRPLANRAFKSKTGANMKEWQASIEDLMKRQKEWLAAFQKNENAKLSSINKLFIENYPPMKEALNNLLKYIVETPKEAARFTKDQNTLKIINETATRQAAALKASIESLHEAYLSVNKK